MPAKHKKVVSALIVLVLLILAIQLGRYLTKVRAVKIYSNATLLMPDPQSPQMSPSAQWHNTIKINSTVSAHLSAASGAPWPQVIHYSDEADSRNLSYTHIRDYAVIEVKLDPKSMILYIQTTDNCWQGAQNKNLFICEFDLTKRKCISRYEISPTTLRLFDKPHH